MSTATIPSPTEVPELPLRVEQVLHHGHRQVLINYDHVGAAGQRLPMKLWVGPPLDEVPPANAKYYRDPLGVAILQMLARLDVLIAENAELKKQLQKKKG